MDCSMCNMRSAVESCSKCHALLCEECALTCSKCGARVCAQHSYTTHKGKNLCLSCQELRKAARRGDAPDIELTDAQLAEKALEVMEAGEEEEEDQILLASMRKATPPWKLSLYTAGAGVLLVLILFAIPSLRRITLPWGGSFATPYLFLIIPAVSLFWSGVGLLDKEFIEDRNRCWYGLAVAVASIILMIIAVYTDPATIAERNALQEFQQRKQMSPQEMKTWREKKLDKFRKTAQ